MDPEVNKKFTRTNSQKVEQKKKKKPLTEEEREALICDMKSLDEKLVARRVQRKMKIEVQKNQ